MWNKKKGGWLSFVSTTKWVKGGGRIVRDSYGNFLKIIEEKECDEDKLKISEVNAGIYCVKCKDLFI